MKEMGLGTWKAVEGGGNSGVVPAARCFISDFLEKNGSGGGYAVVDGGLATELERQGADLNDPLWSAKCLVHSPQLIRRVHLDYIDAGASIIISASYQATIQGFEAKGYARDESEALLKKSVEIACEARETYRERSTKASSGDDYYYGGGGRPTSVLVAASVGSYGAYLADGSEYTGVYGNEMNLEALKDFHRRRVQVLCESGADLIAFETIPNKLEARAYAELLEELDDARKIPSWFSFSSKDGLNAVSGDSILDCAKIADGCNQVAAVGINCTPPRFIHQLILSIKKVTDKPIIIYPNSGEAYDGVRKEWIPSTRVVDDDFVSYVGKWRQAGASLIGGCCRTTPNTIKAISTTLSNK